MDIKNGETLSDERFTDEHIRAIETACEKLWNGIPAENPIYGPRPHDHPLYIVGTAAHRALNTACAELAALRAENKQLKEELAKIKNVES